MRGSVADQRLQYPTANRWDLTGGAFLDGQEIVLPTETSQAAAWIPVHGVTATLIWRVPVLIPVHADRRRIEVGATYRGADRRTSITGFGRGSTPTPQGVWTTAPWTLQPGPNVHWVRLRILPKAAAIPGAVGTRFRPQHDDYVITHL